jgi:hypothetical protein
MDYEAEWFAEQMAITSHPKSFAHQQTPLGHAIVDSTFPFYFSSSMIKKGGIVLGKSAPDISTRILLPLLASVTRFPISVVVYLFKDDPATLASIAEYAKVAGKTLRVLTTVPGRHSYCFNLIEQLLELVESGQLTSFRAAEIFLGAAGHDFLRPRGLGFHRATLAILSAFFFQAWRFPKGERSASHFLHRLFNDPATLDAPTDLMADARASMLEILLSWANLNITNNQQGIDPGEHLNIRDFLDHNEVWVFVLPAEPTHYIAQGVTELLTHFAPDSQSLRVLHVIDQTSSYYSPLVSSCMRRGESQGLAWWFACRHEGQLKKDNEDYRRDIFNYAGTKILLSLDSVEQLHESEVWGGETKYADFDYAVDIRDAMAGDLHPRTDLVDTVWPNFTWTPDPLPFFGLPIPRVHVRKELGPVLSTCKQLQLFSQPGYGLIRVSQDADWYASNGRQIPAYFPALQRRQTPLPIVPGSIEVKYDDAFAQTLQANSTPKVRHGAKFAQERRQIFMPREGQ